MMENTTDTAPASPPVALAAMALEMGTTVEALERDVGPANVFMAGGFRSVTAFRARELLEAHHARKAETERLMAANAERTRKYVAAQHAAIPKGFTKFELTRQTINPAGDDGVPAVVKMTAAADKTFDGGTYTRRPSAVDWIGGTAEGGASIGPTRKQMQENAKANRRAKGKGT